MICGGINFSLHYLAFTGKPLSYLKNSEFKYFAAIVIVTISVVSSILFLTGSYGDIFEALRYASFQVVSIITTTGFTTADYSIWPFATQMILMLLMFIGACSGSTSGSVKVVRIVLLFKYAYREIFRLIHPSAFASVKLGGKVVQKDIMESVSGFFLFYIGIFAVASLIMTTLNVDIITSMSSVAASLGNVGPGLGKVGPMENYFAIPTAGKALLTFCMILGRLEIYTVLILLVPAFWKK
jgi:trk system potassium uptake protein TrkH